MCTQKQTNRLKSCTHALYPDLAARGACKNQALGGGDSVCGTCIKAATFPTMDLAKFCACITVPLPSECIAIGGSTGGPPSPPRPPPTAAFVALLVEGGNKHELKHGGTSVYAVGDGASGTLTQLYYTSADCSGDPMMSMGSDFPLKSGKTTFADCAVLGGGRSTRPRPLQKTLFVFEQLGWQAVHAIAILR